MASTRPTVRKSHSRDSFAPADVGHQARGGRASLSHQSSYSAFDTLPAFAAAIGHVAPPAGGGGAMPAGDAPGVDGGDWRELRKQAVEHRRAAALHARKADIYWRRRNAESARRSEQQAGAEHAAALSADRRAAAAAFMQANPDFQECGSLNLCNLLPHEMAERARAKLEHMIQSGQAARGSRIAVNCEDPACGGVDTAGGRLTQVDEVADGGEDSPTGGGHLEKIFQPLCARYNLKLEVGRPKPFWVTMTFLEEQEDSQELSDAQISGPKAACSTVAMCLVLICQFCALKCFLSFAIALSTYSLVLLYFRVSHAYERLENVLSSIPFVCLFAASSVTLFCGYKCCILIIVLGICCAVLKMLWHKLPDSVQYVIVIQVRIIMVGSVGCQAIGYAKQSLDCHSISDCIQTILAQLHILSDAG